jgi:curli biogenesis system outer membrane secretion channel CsgG
MGEKMNKTVILRFSLAIMFLGGILSGCLSTGTTTNITEGQGSPTIDEAQAESYNGPKARIAVAQFKDKTGKGWWTGEIGDGMADQLTTALFNTNRYIVLERQTLDTVLSEQDLGASGRVREDTAAAIGEIEGAELLVVGAVTEFEGAASGGGGGVGGWGGKVLGSIAGGFKKAHMAIDLRIIDARTSRILAATSVEGEASDVNLGGLLGGWGGSGALAGGLGGWKNTPTEKALRICIKKAVDFIVTKTPQHYYHIGGN